MDKVTVTGDVKDFPLETIVQLDANRIAAEMVHKAIDNTVWDEVDYPGIKDKLHKVVDEWKKKYDEEVMRRLKEGMTNVEIFLDELGKLPHDNGSNLTWWAATDYDKRAVKIVMRDHTCKPIKTKTLFCSFDDIYAMPDPRYGAALAIENLYYDFGEHIIDEKLLMSPDEAASILREFTKDFEENGAWDIEDDVLITALKVAINCLEVKL